MAARKRRRKYFGTDGIRGSVGSGHIMPDFVMRLGWAAGRVLAKEGSNPVLVGKDTRISGYMFESCLEAGLSAAGVDIRLLGPIPTPGIAYLTKCTRAQAGIVISASHNPYHDNGIKFFSSQGTKLSDAIEEEIEQEIGKPLRIVPSSLLGKARRLTDAPRRYIEFCKSCLPSPVDFSGLRVVVDCANGATYHVAPRVFEELGAEVITHADKPDGLNINVDSGACHPEVLCRLIKETRADAGIALDGDGDRLLMADHRGNVLDGDTILYIIACAHKEQLNGGVVGTIMSNTGLERALRDLKLDFHRSAVGDRHVLDMLQKRELLLGGESSGHLIHLGMSTTGDGIIAALQVLHAMATAGRALSELTAGLDKIPQRMRNVRLAEGTAIPRPSVLKKLAADMEQKLHGKGRVVLRSSGTEPLLRIMVEGDDDTEVESLLNELDEEVRRKWVAPETRSDTEPDAGQEQLQAETETIAD